MDPKQNTNQPTGNQQSAQQPTVSVVQPIAPVGGTKEAPIPVAKSSEWLTQSTPEVILPQEVKAAGVESKPVVETISEDAKQAGVRMAHSAMPVPTVSEETVNIKTPRNILVQLKNAHKKVSEGFSWLVRLVIKEQDKQERGGVL